MKGVLKLVVCLVSLFLVATMVVPIVNKLPLLSTLQQTVRKWDINTAAFFYTDEISTSSEVRKHTDL